MRLLLADDHALFRDALVQYIERAEPHSTVMLARDMHEVMEIMDDSSDFDMVLLDMRMPGMSGLQGLQKLREDYPAVPVAMLSGVAEKSDVEQAIELGAKAYFSKAMSGKALINALKKVLEGHNYVAMDHNTQDVMPSYYADKTHSEDDHGYGMSDQLQSELSSDAESLTNREREVLGQSNKEIARALDLQVVTIKLHVRGICNKLGAKNRTQAALFAQQMGMGQKAV